MAPPDAATPVRRVVLAGAGHAHLHTLAHAADFTRRGIELLVIAPENFWYSGMATGVLGGQYAPVQDQVDVATLVTRGGGRFVWDRLVAIDPAARVVRVAGGQPFPFDALSLNLGSETRPLPGENDRVFSLKPLHEIWRLRQALEAARAAGKKSRIVVAGGGASGCEIAANIRALLGREAEITLLAHGREIAASFPAGTRRVLARALAACGISIQHEAPLARIDGNIALTPRGARFPFDFLVNATGLHAPEILRQSGLPVSERGELLVDAALRSTGHPRIFGGGDGVRGPGRALAKVGVYAVRQAPILLHNLLAVVENRSLRNFRPQRNFLLILNLGGGVGLACWRNFHWLGRAAFWWKDRIDRRFLARNRPRA